MIASPAVQRVLSILIGALLLAHGLLPALPTYVCAGMGGVHLLQPCCPDEKSSPDEHDLTRLRRAPCCDAQAKVAPLAQWAPQLKSRSAIPIPVAISPSAAVPMPSSFVQLYWIKARGDPRIDGRQSRHRILRI